MMSGPIQPHASTKQTSAVVNVAPSMQLSGMLSNTGPVNNKPNLQLSGALAQDTNTHRGIVIKYNEPPEAAKPDKRWFLFPFKGEQTLEQIPIYRQSAYLLGRARAVADIPIDHPSCSSQHAVIQFRRINKNVIPYLIDLESSNGTKLNGEPLDARRYYELREKDEISFGFSSRQYIILNENSKDDLQ